MINEVYNNTKIKEIIVELAYLIKEYKKSNELIHPQNIRNELAKLLNVEENEKTNIVNIKEYFTNLADLCRIFDEMIGENIGLLYSPLELPRRFRYYLEYIPKYNIYFEENYTDVLAKEVSDIYQVTHIPNSTNELPTPYQFRYTFNGWYMDKELTNMVDLGMKLNSDITLYAKWVYGKYVISYVTFSDTYIPNSYTDALLSSSNLPIPSKQGYVFEGWYLKNTGGIKGTYENKVDYGMVLTNNITLYAKYTPIEYTINFVMGDNSYAQQIEPIKMAYFNVLPIPEDVGGYTFSGWYTNSFLNTPVNIVYTYGQKLLEDITVYAKWEFTTYTVTFSSPYWRDVYPTSVDGQTVYDTSNYPSLTFAGHKFVGWYEDVDCTIPVEDGKKLFGNVTIYALWDLFTITLENNGGAGSDKIIKVERIPEDIHTAYVPTKLGYTFEGWYYDINFSNRVVANVRLTDDVTFYAKYTPLIHTLKFDNNGHGIKPNDRKFGTSILSTSYLPILEEPGYEFLGWYSSKELADSAQDNKLSEILIDRDMTIYAGWREQYYDIHFNTSVGEIDLTINRSYMPSAEELLSIKPSFIGAYTFEGWYMDSNFSNLPIYGSKLISNIELYAFMKKKGVKIVFDENGGEPVDDMYNNYGKLTVDWLWTCKRPGYTFVGWVYTDPSGVEHLIDENNPYVIPMNTDLITLTARWEQNFYNVTFISNGGNEFESVTQSMSFLYFRDFPNVTKPNTYNHEWYIEPTLQTPVTYNQKITGDMVLYAKWYVNQYKVTIDFNSAVTNLGAKYFYVYESIIPMSRLPQEPDVAGYTFLGWATSQSEDAIITQSSYPITGDVTFYAIWRAEYYTITYVENGGNELSDYYGTHFPSRVPNEQDISRQDYIFEGWYLDPTLETLLDTNDFYNKKLTTNITLYAKWQQVLYTINFYSNGIKIYPSIDLPKGSYIISNLVNNPERIGYDFNGWYNTQDNAVKGELEGRITDYYPLSEGENNLYASWKPKVYDIRYDNMDYANFISNPPYKHTYNKDSILVDAYDEYDVFEGWYLDPELTNGPIKTLEANEYANEIILYAKWKGQVTKTYSGSITGIGQVEHGTNLFYYYGITTYDIGYEGYIFDYKLNTTNQYLSLVVDEHKITVVYKGPEEGPAYYDLEITYGRSKQYTITYYPNGGDGNSITQTIQAGKINLQNNSYSRYGYNFVSWNTQSDGTGVSYSAGQILTLTSNLTLFAQWELKTYTITYRHTNKSNEDSATNTGTQEDYELWISSNGNGELKEKLGYFTNPAKTYTVTHGTSIGIVVRTRVGGNKSYIKLNGNVVAPSGGGASSQADYTFTATSNLDINFNWYQQDNFGLYLEYSYWTCEITTS